MACHTMGITLPTRTLSLPAPLTPSRSTEGKEETVLEQASLGKVIDTLLGGLEAKGSGSKISQGSSEATRNRVVQAPINSSLGHAFEQPCELGRLRAFGCSVASAYPPTLLILMSVGKLSRRASHGLSPAPKPTCVKPRIFGLDPRQKKNTLWSIGGYRAPVRPCFAYDESRSGTAPPTAA